MWKKTGKVLSTLLNAKINKKKLIAILFDPDREPIIPIEKLALIKRYKPHFIFIGGSYLTNHVDMDGYIIRIKENTEVPVVLFPGSLMQLSKFADALLFLSLLGSRAVEFIWGYHFQAAPILKKWSIEVIPTAYVITGSCSKTPIEFMAQYIPPPPEKPYIFEGIAITAELLGFSTIYLEGGSGSSTSPAENVIGVVSSATELPVIVGGGIKTILQLERAYMAGADLVVIGTALEENFSLLPAMIEKCNSL